MWVRQISPSGVKRKHTLPTNSGDWCTVVLDLKEVNLLSVWTITYLQSIIHIYVHKDRCVTN